AMQQAVTDPARCAFAVVFTAEALPVAETLEVVDNLRGMGVAVGALIANRRSPADAGELLHARRDVEDAHLRHVRGAVSDVPMFEIPLMPGELTGSDALAALADLLESA
uniref:ArsA-related P-loop ATPase n=1 Tax=Clavibacter michiganensis TaxID=28447 RepID=UPI00293075D5